jgi:hypothetical protein
MLIHHTHTPYPYTAGNPALLECFVETCKWCSGTSVFVGPIVDTLQMFNVDMLRTAHAAIVRKDKNAR